MSKTEQTTADEEHITQRVEEGWERLDSEDIEGAERCAREALLRDPESPDAVTLLGGVAARRGELEEALTHWRRASEFDPDYVTPLLLAAELHLEHDGDIDEAIALCEQALDAAEEEEEYLDALMCKAEAELAGDYVDEARETLAELPPPTLDLPDSTYHLRAGRLLFEAGELDAAAAHYGRVLSAEPGSGDAHHGLALVAEAREDAAAMVEHFLATREADLKEPSPAWGVAREQFEALAEAALAELPERVRKLLAEVPVIAADYPSVELVRDGLDPRSMGFFAGTPFPEQPNVGGAPELTTIHLYQRNIERLARTTPEVAAEIGITLMHEAGHFFGLDEDELAERGLD